MFLTVIGHMILNTFWLGGHGSHFPFSRWVLWSWDCYPSPPQQEAAASPVCDQGISNGSLSPQAGSLSVNFSQFFDVSSSCTSVVFHVPRLVKLKPCWGTLSFNQDRRPCKALHFCLSRCKQWEISSIHPCVCAFGQYSCVHEVSQTELLSAMFVIL